MNWKLRFKNKVTLVSIIALIVSVVYKILNMCGVIPTIESQEIIDVANYVIDALCLMGIVTDPTTSGITDSAQAMTYSEPKK